MFIKEKINIDIQLTLKKILKILITK